MMVTFLFDETRKRANFFAFPISLCILTQKLLKFHPTPPPLRTSDAARRVNENGVIGPRRWLISRCFHARASGAAMMMKVYIVAKIRDDLLIAWNLRKADPDCRRRVARSPTQSASSRGTAKEGRCPPVTRRCYLG